MVCIYNLFIIILTIKYCHFPYFITVQGDASRRMGGDVASQFGAAGGTLGSREDQGLMDMPDSRGPSPMPSESWDTLGSREERGRMEFPPRRGDLQSYVEGGSRGRSTTPRRARHEQDRRSRSTSRHEQPDVVELISPEVKPKKPEKTPFNGEVVEFDELVDTPPKKPKKTPFNGEVVEFDELVDTPPEKQTSDVKASKKKGVQASKKSVSKKSKLPHLAQSDSSSDDDASEMVAKFQAKKAAEKKAKKANIKTTKRSASSKPAARGKTGNGDDIDDSAALHNRMLDLFSETEIGRRLKEEGLLERVLLELQYITDGNLEERHLEAMATFLGEIYFKRGDNLQPYKMVE